MTPRNLLFFAFTLVSCGDKGEDSGTPDADADTDADTGSGSWEISYSGDLSGTVAGDVTVVTFLRTSVQDVALAGESSAGDQDLSGSYYYATSDPAEGKKEMLALNVGLEDGTSCSLDQQNEIRAMATVIDGTEDGYHAELSGQLECGKAIVSFTGYFRK